jgi:glutathione S-transferase
MLKLIHFRLCPFSRSVRLALAELKIETQLEDERPWEWRAELLALNPSGELPVLCAEAAPPVCGAYAISEYLADEQSEAPSNSGMRLFPGGSQERAEVRRLVDWFHGKLDREVTHPLIEEKVYSRFETTGTRKPDSGALRYARESLSYHLTYLEFLTHDHNWLAGPEPSFADLCATSHLSCLDYLDEIAWDERPGLRQWYARMKSRPSLRAMLAERVPGAPLPPAHYANLDF